MAGQGRRNRLAVAGITPNLHVIASTSSTVVPRNRPGPGTVVNSGEPGDLTHRKLIPALANPAVDGVLPTGVNIIGFNLIHSRKSPTLRP